MVCTTPSSRLPNPVSHPSLLTPRAELRSKAIHFLAGDQRPSAQVPPRDIARQRPASRHLYVCLSRRSRLPASPVPPPSTTRIASDKRSTPNLPDMIDKQTKEIRQDEDQTVYKSLDELADDLPDHSPRFILLSYPLTLVCLTVQSYRSPRRRRLTLRVPEL